MSTEADDAAFAAAEALQAAGRLTEAVAAYKALARKVITVRVALALGRCTARLGLRAEAEYWLGLVVQARPNSAEAHRLLAVALAESGKVRAAEKEYAVARRLEPENLAVQLSLAALFLSVGRWREGWPLLECRAARSPALIPPVTVAYPEWKGEALGGRSILVWVEQGFGDQIQFARFAPMLKAHGAGRVTLACRPPLAHLFSTLEGVDAILPVPVGVGVAVPPHDLWSRYVSLPGHLGVTVETLPGAPYLSAPADRRGQPPPRARVGLAWRASATGFNAGLKSLDDGTAQRLLDRGAISLLPEHTGARDFADTAAIIETLDLVISIDTAVAHLAGAMGKPCWTLIPYVDADWRWLRDRADSPWYPAMRLFRQSAPGSWEAEIAAVLAQWPD